MAVYFGREFNGVKELVDGNSYTQCTFNDCTLIYRGGQIPMITSCQFERCTWGWEDAAGRTVEFLRFIRARMGSGGRQLVDDVARHIRTPFPTTTP
jgi:hypothetical protein